MSMAIVLEGEADTVSGQNFSFLDTIHLKLYLDKMSAFWTQTIHLKLYLDKMSVFWTLAIH